jgi:hypothetical protein
MIAPRDHLARMPRGGRQDSVHLAMKRVHGLVLVLGLLAACRAPSSGAVAGPPWDESPVQTDSLVYTLRRTPQGYDATATLRYVNRTGRAVHYQQCSP